MVREEEEEDASNIGRMARLLIICLLAFRDNMFYYSHEREVAHKQSR